MAKDLIRVGQDFLGKAALQIILKLLPPRLVGVIQAIVIAHIFVYGLLFSPAVIDPTRTTSYEVEVEPGWSGKVIGFYNDPSCPPLQRQGGVLGYGTTVHIPILPTGQYCTSDDRVVPDGAAIIYVYPDGTRQKGDILPLHGQGFTTTVFDKTLRFEIKPKH